jgi:hypothetical protein
LGSFAFPGATASFSDFPASSASDFIAKMNYARIEAEASLWKITLAGNLSLLKLGH